VEYLGKIRSNTVLADIIRLVEFMSA